MTSLRRIELLAPARDVEVARAAIDCGADAVYIGGSGFGARSGASNATDDIRRLADYAHAFGAKVYATLNTILFDNELERAEHLSRELIGAGVDALIVQDMAYLRMGLGAELHASTQMFNASPEWAAFLAECGFGRLVLERNMSLEQIRAVRARCDAELEVFVHGAVCVCYSGRCYMSRSMGPRSGNRGECSQPCRMTYDLTDSSGRRLAEGKHLLSVQDLNLSGRIGDLINAGVDSFKIEGRLKDMDYVRNTVAMYNSVINAELLRRDGIVRASDGNSVAGFVPDLRKSFTRSGGQYFFDGVRRGVATFDTPKSVGESVGRVGRVAGEWFSLASAARLAAGDGVCFFAGGKMEGTNINRVEEGQVFPNRMQGIKVGTELYRNFDAAFHNALQRASSRRTVSVHARVEADCQQVRLTFTDALHIASIGMEGEFDRAANEGRMREIIAAQVSKSGGTVFDVADVNVECDGEMPFVPSAAINDLRRRGLERLLAERLADLRPNRQFVENRLARLPFDTADRYCNVSNRMAAEFYSSHGARSVEQALDLSDELSGSTVMRTRYCLRREMGQCLKQGGKAGDWFIEHGALRYRLDFDCRLCEMSVVKITNKTKEKI